MGHLNGVANVGNGKLLHITSKSKDFKNDTMLGYNQYDNRQIRQQENGICATNGKAYTTVHWK